MWCIGELFYEREELASKKKEAERVGILSETHRKSFNKTFPPSGLQQRSTGFYALYIGSVHPLGA